MHNWNLMQCAVWLEMLTFFYIILLIFEKCQCLCVWCVLEWDVRHKWSKCIYASPITQTHTHTQKPIHTHTLTRTYTHAHITNEYEDDHWIILRM